MSDELISRKKVLAIIASRLNSSKIGSLENQRLYSISKEVENLSTAYDADKVVEEIRKYADNIAELGGNFLLQVVIEIVKSGGVAK